MGRAGFNGGNGMSRSIDITNKRFGRLTAIKRVDDYVSPSGVHAERWECACDCGKRKIILKSSLFNGTSTSCGCYRVETKTKSLLCEIKGNTATIKCPNGKEFLIDTSDLDFVIKYRWHIAKNGYVRRNDDKKLLHRLLLQADEKHVIDHINQNKLDNRRRNLRMADYSINGINKNPVAGKSGELYISLSHDYYSVYIDGKYVGGSYDLEKAKDIRDSKIKGSKAYRYNSKLKNYF